MFVFCFFKQKTAYEMRISDWSSDVCSSDLGAHKIRALRCDSADAQALQMTITSAAGEHDGIEVLVNNAGAGVFRSIEELTLADFDQMVTINLRAVFVAIQAALQIGRASCRERAVRVDLGGRRIIKKTQIHIRVRTKLKTQLKKTN